MENMRGFRFDTLVTAREFAAKCAKPMGVILGWNDEDGECYWVVDLVTMEKLLRMGFQLAE